jgi:hypothetical protein
VTAPTLIVLLIAIVAVFVLPRRWVPVPFLVVACYIPKSQTIDVGAASFTVLRTLTAVALVRVLLRNNWRGVSLTAGDFLMLCWATFMVGTVALHEDPATQVVGRLGLALDGLGLYLVFRFFCRSSEDVTQVCVALGLVLVPLAASMLYEKFTAQNLLSLFGSGETPRFRLGSVRAQGPFKHSILAGTVGALSVPFMATLWRTNRTVAATGLIACACIVVSSNSSGPIMSLATAIVALCLWPLRLHTRIFVWSGVAAYFVLAILMTRPPYYLISRIDLTGGSTGWHRSRLIESSLQHFDEWWVAGTGHTRHWMATGVAWSSDHTDITNHFIALGVYGGLPLLLSFLAVLATSFRHVGQQLRRNPDGLVAWAPWAFGCALFTIAVTGVSISFFDQSILWLYMTIALCNTAAGERVAEVSSAPVSIRDAVARHRAARRLRVRKLGLERGGDAIGQRP